MTQKLPPAKKRSIPLSTRFTKSEMKMLDQEAKKRGVSKAMLVWEYAKKGLEKEEDTTPA